MMNIVKITRCFLAMLICVCTFSCKDTFDLKPENVLRADQMYQNVNDADAAIFGIIGKLITVMDRYVVLNELRGDLMDVTPNADKYLKEINNHAVSDANPWADPRPLFELILNCNDVMKNFNIMLSSNRINQANYGIRYSEVATVRSWAYLQLGIHYGSVPYVTDPLANIEDIDDASKYPLITFDQLLDKLIAEVSNLPVLNPIQLVCPQKVVLLVPEGASLIKTIDGYSTQRMFINRHQLLGELYLWKGNYPLAARYLRMPLEYGTIVDATKTDLFGNYMREYPSNNGNDKWSTTFTSTFDNDDKNSILTNLPFDKSFKPANPFVTLFSHAGKYQLRPSALAISNWDNQVRTDGSPIDINRGPNKSYSTGPEPEVKKLLGSFNPATPFATNGKIILGRAAGLMLHFAEAANRDGRDQLAFGFLNIGVKNGIFNGPPPTPTNVVNIKQHFDTNPDYYFDGRQGSFPFFAGPWIRMEGMRGHVSLQPVLVDSAKYYDMSNKGLWDKPVKAGQELGLAIATEDLLVNESALEMAYEGVRWPDLLRVAIRREKEQAGSGLAFIKAKIEAKFAAAGKPVPEGVAKLGASVNNWYLPFKL
jgi:starch-binding outer membrane protein, SusD/RagB family